MIPVVAVVAGACGGAGERVTIRGDFADTAAVPTAVVAVEGGQQAEVKRGAFSLRDLSAGPITLRLVRGTDTVATLALQNVPAGTNVQLHGLETDAPTRRAFPRTLALNGPGVLVLNGIRMGREPDRVDALGTVIAASEDRAALLVRTSDATLPDLRVVIGVGTEVVLPDSTRLEPADLHRGDSVRVEGGSDQGYVVATRITVNRRITTALRESTADPAPARDEGGGSSAASDEPAPVAASTPRRAAVSAPARIPRERAGRPGIGRGRGKGGGHGRGHGKKG
jgi:hypothetical protein